MLRYLTNLAELCYRLGIPTILSDEVEYLVEYIKLMKPIEEPIDFLQGEKTMYFGYFVSYVVSLRIKLCRLERANFKSLPEVSEKMQISLLKRFEKYFLMKPATTQTEDEVKKMFNTYVVKYDKIPEAETRAIPATTLNLFLDFGEESNDVSVQCDSSDTVKYLQETNLYLVEQDTTTNCLNNHIAIKNVFLKYKIALPSSAPVERLFSFAGIVNRSRRQKLSDVNFEMHVLGKANNI